MPRNVVVLLDNKDGRAMVEEACRENGILFDEFTKLVELEVKQSGKHERTDHWDAFDDILDIIDLNS